MDGCWVHHDVCNRMESTKYSTVKSPYLFSIDNVNVRAVRRIFARGANELRGTINCIFRFVIAYFVIAYIFEMERIILFI